MPKCHPNCGASLSALLGTILSVHSMRPELQGGYSSFQHYSRDCGTSSSARLPSESIAIDFAEDGSQSDVEGWFIRSCRDVRRGVSGRRVKAWAL
ncbi:hypothetical protein BD414DRAFT_472274 [Trametes punicea]|nr:hypothetical protein BD414DRAFT_472274 [Trametes punicea]